MIVWHVELHNASQKCNLSNETITYSRYLSLGNLSIGNIWSTCHCWPTTMSTCEVWSMDPKDGNQILNQKPPHLTCNHSGCILFNPCFVVNVAQMSIVIFNILLIFCPNETIKSSLLIFFHWHTQLYFSPFKNENSFEKKNVWISLFQWPLFSLKTQAHDLIINGHNNK